MRTVRVYRPRRSITAGRNSESWALMEALYRFGLSQKAISLLLGVSRQCIEQRLKRPRHLARARVAYALRVGALVRPDACGACSVPGNVEAHHDDYERPLDVRWLCKACHETAHASTRDSARLRAARADRAAARVPAGAVGRLDIAALRQWRGLGMGDVQALLAFLRAAHGRPVTYAELLPRTDASGAALVPTTYVMAGSKREN